MSFLIVANWKMNGTRSSFVNFINKLNNRNKITSKLVICPPFTSFPDNLKLSNGNYIGAQNCFYKKAGSYTGEVSPEMLKELGCSYVILGHSERANETNKEIKLKSEIAIESGLHPIICVGESIEDYRAKKTREVIAYQCKNRLPLFGDYTVAYEPIWAIGTGYVPNNGIIIDVIELIQQLLANKRHVIYGGSVSLEAIGDLLKISSLSGVLIGSRSSCFEFFYKIVEKVEELINS